MTEGFAGRSGARTGIARAGLLRSGFARSACGALALSLAALVLAASLPASAQQEPKARAPKGKEGDAKAAPPADPNQLKPLNEKQFPQNVSWSAISLNGKGFPGERPSLLLDAQYRIKGFAGCNTFSATAFPLREQRLAVGPFALTRKSCDGGAMASEKNFLQALRSSGKWDLVGPHLVITTGSGELRLERSL